MWLPPFPLLTPKQAAVAYHAKAQLARLQQQEDPSFDRALFTNDPNVAGDGLFMEWAVGKNVDEMEPGYDTLHLRQRFDGRVDAGPDLVRIGRKVRRIAAGRRLRVAQLLLPDAAPVLEDVEREVGDDAKDPRPKRLTGLEPADRRVRLDECLLGEVLRIVRIADESPGDRDDAFHVFCHEVVVRLRAAVFHRVDGAQLQWIHRPAGIGAVRLYIHPGEH